MLRDRRAGHVEMRSDLARRELLVTHELQDAAAARRGDRSQGRLHGLYLSTCLRKAQLTATTNLAAGEYEGHVGNCRVAKERRLPGRDSARSARRRRGSLD